MNNWALYNKDCTFHFYNTGIQQTAKSGLVSAVAQRLFLLKLTKHHMTASEPEIQTQIKSLSNAQMQMSHGSNKEIYKSESGTSNEYLLNIFLW